MKLNKGICEVYTDLEEELTSGEIKCQVFIEELIQLAYSMPNDTVLGAEARRRLQEFNIIVG